MSAPIRSTLTLRWAVEYVDGAGAIQIDTFETLREAHEHQDKLSGRRQPSTLAAAKAVARREGSSHDQAVVFSHVNPETDEAVYVRATVGEVGADDVPRCVRCNETHRVYPHNFHKTNEHDTWLAYWKSQGDPVSDGRGDLP